MCTQFLSYNQLVQTDYTKCSILYFFGYKMEFFPSKSISKIRPDMTLDVYRGRKTTMQKCNNLKNLDLSFKANLDVLGCLKRVKLAKFHRTDLAICSLSREGKTLSYSRINTVI